MGAPIGSQGKSAIYRVHVERFVEATEDEL